MQTAPIFNIQKFSIHDGPGIRTTVFFAGCPLRCAWCSNPESQVYPTKNPWAAKQMRTMTVEEVLDACLQDAAFYAESDGGVTLSGGEPLLRESFGAELAHKLHERNISVAIETTGQVDSAIFAHALTWADLVLFDMKHYDKAAHLAGTGVSNGLILQNLSAALKSTLKSATHNEAPREATSHNTPSQQKIPSDTALDTPTPDTPVMDTPVIDTPAIETPALDTRVLDTRALATPAPIASPKETTISLLVRIPVIPGFNAALSDAQGFSRLLKDVGIARVQLLPFHQMGENKYERLGRDYAYKHEAPLHEEDLAKYQSVFEKAGIDAFF